MQILLLHCVVLLDLFLSVHAIFLITSFVSGLNYSLLTIKIISVQKIYLGLGSALDNSV